MKKKLFSYFLKSLVPAVAIVLLFFITFNLLGCPSTFSGLNILTGDFTVPKIQSFALKDERSLSMEFSKEINVQELSVVCRDGDELEAVDCSFEVDEEGKLYVSFGEDLQVGKNYQIDGTVADLRNNGLSFSIPFKGYNSRIPRMIISEVRNAYGSSSINKVKHYKTEFVELFVLSDGNLSGVQIVSSSDGMAKSYTCPPVEVKAGTYVTVHMRAIPQDRIVDEKLVSETEGNLSASYSLDTTNSALDLWSENQEAVFAATDIISVMNTQDNVPIDALCYCVEGKNLDAYKDFVNLLEEKGLWQGEAFDATKISSSATTKSISRQNVAAIYGDFKAGLYDESSICSKKEDWIVAKGATPGAKNSMTPA